MHLLDIRVLISLIYEYLFDSITQVLQSIARIENRCYLKTTYARTTVETFYVVVNNHIIS